MAFYINWRKKNKKYELFKKYFIINLTIVLFFNLTLFLSNMVNFFFRMIRKTWILSQASCLRTGTAHVHQWQWISTKEKGSVEALKGKNRPDHTANQGVEHQKQTVRCTFPVGHAIPTCIKQGTDPIDREDQLHEKGLVSRLCRSHGSSPNSIVGGPLGASKQPRRSYTCSLPPRISAHKIVLFPQGSARGVNQ